MIKPGQGLSCTIAIVSGFVLATSGCATKKYVSKQIEPVNQRLGQFEKQTNDRLAWLNNKEQSDVADVNARVAATDQRLAQVAQVANSAQASVTQLSESNSASRSTEEMEMTNVANTAVANALNYQLVDKADVTFGFNKANLTPGARSTLDAIVAKFQSSPRAVVELAGFTDPIGSSNYNLGLSRRRAWAVQRYLVEHNVPVRSIHIVGMGEEAPPPDLQPTSSAATGTKAEYRRERRVNVRVYGAGEIAGTSGTQ
jgi:outer membrane protein OmpA-like peptidoglycan-associated protein